ncbi:MAG: hypothetical protein B7Z16_15740, partial [Algoriphagus sp. 32-45-6]
MKEYAVGNGNFSTMTIAATLVATYMSGSDFFTYLSESYNNGLYFIWAAAGDVIGLLIIAYLFAPRIGEFLGKLSIADAMGGLYGDKVRIVTSIASCIKSAGMIAVQLKVAGMLIEYGFDIPSSYGVLIAAVIVGFYTSLGGIKSVTFTDVIQLFTFGTIIPTLAFFIFGSLESIDTVSTTIQNSPLFNYKEVFDFSNVKSLSYLFLFVYIVMPKFNPPIFQRMAMARNTRQVHKSFLITAIACLFITVTMSFIGIFVLSAEPAINPNDIVKHILSHYSYLGLKGLTLAGIMAMVMSTVDSYVNATSVLFIHDLCRPLKLKFANNELKATRVAAFFITAFALLLTLTGQNLLNLIILTGSLYIPIVSIPFAFAVFGFRTSSKAVLISMAAGFSTVLFWRLVLHSDAIDSVVPSMLANLIFLMGSHYLLKQPGGWVGIKDPAPLISIRQQRKRNIASFFNKVVNFDCLIMFRKSTPVQESMYVAVSFFCIIVTYAAIFTLPKDIASKYASVIDTVYPSMLFLSTALLSYPLWPRFLKASNAIVIVWNFVIFSILICACFLFVLISNFASIQLT